MSLGMENLLEDIYAPNDVPYWGENIPVTVVRQLIEEAEKQTLNKAMDKLCDVIDGFSKLGMTDEASSVSCFRSYQGRERYQFHRFYTTNFTTRREQMKHTCPICSAQILMANYGKHMMEFHIDALRPAIKGENK